jgi:hypothetical protein|tara:strand:- start:273 stop:956 length:684 start_codon:yes stop_codon:yes gene_type:complete
MYLFGHISPEAFSFFNMGIKENIQKIKKELSNSVTLVVAVKYASLSQIKELIDLGVKNIGFNTYQQLRDVKDIISKGTKIHFIGHLQKNKVRKVLEYGVYLIQSVDSYELAEKINKVCDDLGIKQDILLQVKTDENKKYGIDVSELDNIASEINKNLKNLNIKGLMTIPPLADNTEKYFVLVKKLYDKLSKTLGVKFEYLSMGMSDDYINAVKEGANMVRLGRIVFE